MKLLDKDLSRVIRLGSMTKVLIHVISELRRMQIGYIDQFCSSSKHCKSASILLFIKLTPRTKLEHVTVHDLWA